VDGVATTLILNGTNVSKSTLYRGRLLPRNQNTGKPQKTIERDNCAVWKALTGRIGQLRIWVKMTLLGREIVKTKQKWPIFEASWGERYFRNTSP